MSQKQYPVCDLLTDDASVHCAALVVTENLTRDAEGNLNFSQPSHDLRNGTLTFVKTRGKIYGITCWHVIEHFRKQLMVSGNPHSHSMRTMVNGFYIVHDRFIRPEPQFGDPALDIAIRELKDEFVSAIGKVPIDLDASNVAPAQIGHGYAIGFPESLKYRKDEEDKGYRVSMPQVEILAEIERMPMRRFALFSELKVAPKHIDFSGMSGGPIFWSTEESYGIYGIIYEGGVGDQTASGNTIYVYGELATPAVIHDWVAQIEV